MNFKRLFLVVWLAMQAATSALAKDQNTLMVGMLSDDFLGRSEHYGNLSFSSAMFTGRQSLGRASINYKIGIQETESDFEGVLQFDAATRLGASWHAGIGIVDRHWSFSNYTSLVLSRNAKPATAFYVSGAPSQAIGAPFSWLGQTTVDFFVGVTNDLGQPEDAKLAGFRFTTAPTSELDIELVRMI